MLDHRSGASFGSRLKIAQRFNAGCINVAQMTSPVRDGRTILSSYWTRSSYSEVPALKRWAIISSN
jgi:hypothetical protein